MKTMLQKLVTLLVVIATVCSISVYAFAAGTVTYQGQAERFIFAPGSEYSPTDLFSGFKNVMPGDRLAEQILIRNNGQKDVSIKVYLRSKGAQEGTDAFLSQMKLTVTQNGDTNLFEAPADQTGGLTEWVCLGTVKYGAEILLDVVLEVPITMGNDWQHKIGYIDWEFKIEEFPSEPTNPDPSDPDIPQTGDRRPVALAAVLAGVSFAAIVLLLMVAKKRKDQQMRK